MGTGEGSESLRAAHGVWQSAGWSEWCQQVLRDVGDSRGHRAGEPGQLWLRIQGIRRWNDGFAAWNRAGQRERDTTGFQTNRPEIDFDSGVLVVWEVFEGHSGFARVSHPVFRDDGKSGATGTTVLFGTDDRTGGRGFLSRRCIAVAAVADWTESSA